jgi:hypothetical protein
MEPGSDQQRVDTYFGRHPDIRFATEKITRDWQPKSLALRTGHGGVHPLPLSYLVVPCRL